MASVNNLVATEAATRGVTEWAMTEAAEPAAATDAAAADKDATAGTVDAAAHEAARDASATEVRIKSRGAKSLEPSAVAGSNDDDVGDSSRREG